MHHVQKEAFDGRRDAQAASTPRHHRQRHVAGPRARKTVRSRARSLRGHDLQRRAARQLRPHHAVAGAVGREDLRSDRHPRRRLVRRSRRDALQGPPHRRDRPRRQDRDLRARRGRALRQADHRHGLDADRHPRAGIASSPACSPTATSTTSTPCCSRRSPAARRS